MIEVTSPRKTKISLSDYNFQKDIENRLLMAQFTSLEIEVLEEILYSSLHFPIKKIEKSLGIEEDELFPILDKISKTGLIKLSDETILVDKEMRKYYECELLKFEEDFVPGMEYLQSLLRKIPIHILPTWYSIPRSSDNIFDSLIEKYLLTPQTFQRYLSELHLNDATLSSIINDVYSAPDFLVLAKDLKEKYGFGDEQLEEHLLALEFSFACCLGYAKIDDEWHEVVTPFHEWREYMRFMKETEARPIDDESVIQRKRPNDFSFVQDLALVLSLGKKQPISVTKTSDGQYRLQKAALQAFLAKSEGWTEDDPSLFPYLHEVVSKLCLLNLADHADEKLVVQEAATEWLEMRLENRALYLYRNPLNRIISSNLPAHLCTEKNIREAEKGIQRVLYSGWVYFDDFIKGAFVNINEDCPVTLKRFGKTWRYTTPNYSDEEKELIKETLFKGLFEIGVVAVGTHEGRDCFSVTSFGQSLFGR